MIWEMIWSVVNFPVNGNDEIIFFSIRIDDQANTQLRIDKMRTMPSDLATYVPQDEDRRNLLTLNCADLAYEFIQLFQN